MTDDCRTGDIIHTTWVNGPNRAHQKEDGGGVNSWLRHILAYAHHVTPRDPGFLGGLVNHFDIGQLDFSGLPTNSIFFDPNLNGTFASTGIIPVQRLIPEEEVFPRSGPLTLLGRTELPIPRPTIPYPEGDGSVPPGPGFIRGGPNENWYNPNTGESLRPDLNHPNPIRPHWDYMFRGDKVGGWRWYPDGRLEPKSVPPGTPPPYYLVPGA